MLGSALRKSLTVTRGLSMTLASDVHTASGVRVSPETAMIASSVYTAVTLNADTVSAFPIRFTAKGDATRTPATPPGIGALTGQKANANQTVLDLIQTINMSLDLWGEAFIAPRYTNGGDALELWPIDPQRITDVEQLTDSPDGIYGLRFRVADWPHNNGWAENRPGRPVEMIHITLRTMPGKLRGMSPIAMQAELLGMSLSAQEHAARFLGDGVHMSGTLESPADLNAEEARELWDNFQLSHAGPRRAGRVGVLTGGATFKAMTIPPNELQFLEQMKYADQKIGAMYHVPPHLMGDVERSTSWGTGIEEQTLNWTKFSLLGRARKIEGAFESSLLAGTPYQMRFVMNGLLRGAAKDRAEFYRVLWNLAALTTNEIRAFEDMGPVEGGDQVYVPLNMTPLGTVPDVMKNRAALLLELIGEGR